MRPPALAQPRVAVQSPASGESAAAGAIPGADLTIFVVDDEPGIRNALKITLERAGYAVEGFADVQAVSAALELCSPFLIILDVTLLRSDAIEAMKIFSDRGFEGAVQLLSGKSLTLLNEILLIGQRRKLRMLPVMTKPCRMQAVRAVADHEAMLRSGPAGMRPGRPNPHPPAATVARQSVCLATAIDEDRLEVWYQPKFDLRNGALIGAECLSRVRQPNGEIALPGSFIPGARASTMRRLTEAVMRRALADWTEFNGAGASLRLSVNVPSQLLTTFPVAALLRDCVPAVEDWAGLILEITEEDALRDVEGAHEAATQLRIYGVELSIDDFGVGYSSLSRLREIPFKEIKLDRSLVHLCASDTTRAAMCRAIVEMAHTLGALVVGEGIEIEADLHYLQSAGCDIAQGFLLGRPMSKADLIGQIAAGSFPSARAVVGGGLHGSAASVAALQERAVGHGTR